MFYFIPIWFVAPPSDGSISEKDDLSCKNEHEIGQIRQLNAETTRIQSDDHQVYLNTLRQELEILYLKQSKKYWSKEENDLLLALRRDMLQWSQISAHLKQTNAEISRRRYFRLIQTQKKWPCQVQHRIKVLYQVEKLKWSKIVKILAKKFPHLKGYQGKMVKERYQFFLREGIQVKRWSVEQDLRLLEQVQARGSSQKQMLPLFQGRTELQLKNRLNGTIKFVDQRVRWRLSLRERLEVSRDRNCGLFCQNIQ